MSSGQGPTEMRDFWGLKSGQRHIKVVGLALIHMRGLIEFNMFFWVSGAILEVV